MASVTNLFTDPGTPGILIDLPSSGTVALVCNPPRIRYPFRNNPITPDIFTRTIERDYKIVGSYYDGAGRLATRTTSSNLLSYSNDFGNAAWTKTATTITSDSIANPWDGTVTVDKMLETGSTSSHRVTRAFTATASVYTAYMIVKGGLGRDWAALELFDSAASDFLAFYNITTGEMGVSQFVYAGMIALKDGFYMCWMTTGSAVAAGAGNIRAYVSTSANLSIPVYAGSTSKGMYIGQIQLDAASTLPPLIITDGITATVSTPDVDASVNIMLSPPNLIDPFAFLIAETDPMQGDALLAGFTRTYARLPGPQAVPSTKYFTRPVMDDVAIAGTAWAVSFDIERRLSWVFYARKDVQSIGVLVLGTTPITESLSSLPASTFTAIDSGGHTISPGLNAGAATLQAAIASALTSLATVTCTSTPNSLTISWTDGPGYMKSIETASTAVVVSGGIESKTITFSSGRTDTEAPNQDPSLRTINCTGHGGVVGDRVVFWNADKIIAKSIVMAVVDADHYSVNAADVDGKDIVITQCGMSSDAAACYVNGAKICTTRKVTNYYLPGYSPNVITYADIPPVTVYADALSWLNRIFYVPSGWAAIDVGDVTQWAGAIVQQEQTQVQMVDALDTVTP